MITHKLMLEIRKEQARIRKKYGWRQVHEDKEWRDILAKQLGDITIAIESYEDVEKQVIQIIAVASEWLGQMS
jgi:hypothetical protein